MSELLPVDDVLAGHRCWMCWWQFELGEFYGYAPRPGHDDTWCTCVGCMAVLACDPGNQAPAE